MQAVFNSSPVNAFYTIQLSQKDSFQAIIEEQLADFLVLSDKVQEPNYIFDSTSFTTKSGLKSTIVHTRYYRRSKAANYKSVFDDSPKSKDTKIRCGYLLASI